MADGRAEMIMVLRQQVDLEVRDRAFLLQLTEKVRRGEYKPSSPRNEQAGFFTTSSRADSHHLTQRGSFIFTDKGIVNKKVVCVGDL
ncbi:hypothetical protein SK128_001737 [Halocaridina rubra]|uniref:Uncharacterized protein n=1 Tax=Halocaridina rubra TaxID=373956 RepID=A0AAN8XF37_HALRR